MSVPDALAGRLPIDMLGDQIGPWKVVHRAPSRRARAQWACVCSHCGSKRTYAGTELRAMARRGIDPCGFCKAVDPPSKGG